MIFIKLKFLKNPKIWKNCKNEEIEEFPKIEQFDKKRQNCGRKLIMWIAYSETSAE